MRELSIVLLKQHHWMFWVPGERGREGERERGREGEREREERGRERERERGREGEGGERERGRVADRSRIDFQLSFIKARKKETT